MQQFELVKWRTGVVKNSTYKVPKAELIVTLSLRKTELTLAKSLFRSYIQLKRTSYFNRYFNHPVKYFDYKNEVFYTPTDIQNKKIDVKKLDCIYAELKQNNHPKLKKYFTVLKRPLFHQGDFTLSLKDRNQTLQYPTLFRSYLEYLYYHGELDIMYDAVSGRFMTIEHLLYDINYLTSLINEPTMKGFIQWINKTYKTEFKLDQITFQTTSIYPFNFSQYRKIDD